MWQDKLIDIVQMTLYLSKKIGHHYGYQFIILEPSDWKRTPNLWVRMGTPCILKLKISSQIGFTRLALYHLAVTAMILSSSGLDMVRGCCQLGSVDGQAYRHYIYQNGLGTIIVISSSFYHMITTLITPLTPSQTKSQTLLRAVALLADDTGLQPSDWKQTPNPCILKLRTSCQIFTTIASYYLAVMAMIVSSSDLD